MEKIYQNGNNNQIEKKIKNVLSFFVVTFFLEFGHFLVKDHVVFLYICGLNDFERVLFCSFLRKKNEKSEKKKFFELGAMV